MSASEPLHAQLEAMRPMLVRFAQLQLRNQTLAEDAVQDALLAVLEQPERFAGQSSLRTYVTGILKFKIIDNLRATTRERQLEPDEGQTEDDAIDALFVADGHTRDMPRDWGNPDATLQQKDFFRVLEICLDKLREKVAELNYRPAERVPTRVPKAAKNRALEAKARRSQIKRLRSKPSTDE